MSEDSDLILMKNQSDFISLTAYPCFAQASAGAAQGHRVAVAALSVSMKT